MLHREITPLRRLLGPLDAASLLIGCVLGAGVLIVPGQIAPRLPSAMLGLTLWLAGAVVSVVGSWCVARLAAEAPTAGGSYSYLRRCYGDTVGFLSGWTGLVIVNCAVPAALALALGSAAKRLMPSLPDPMSSAAFAILGSATVALVGLKLGKQLLNVLSLVKLLGVGLVVGTVLWKQPSVLSRVAEWTSSEPFSWGSIGAAFIGILWTYDGWTYLAFAGDEARQPSRTLRIGFRAGIVVVAVAVLTATTAYYAALPSEQMAASDAPIALTVMNHYWGSAGELLMHPIILAAIFGSLCALFTTASRASLQMARDGALPALLGRVSKRSCVPWVARRRVRWRC